MSRRKPFPELTVCSSGSVLNKLPRIYRGIDSPPEHRILLVGCTWHVFLLPGKIMHRERVKTIAWEKRV